MKFIRLLRRTSCLIALGSLHTANAFKFAPTGRNANLPRFRNGVHYIPRSAGPGYEVNEQDPATDQRLSTFDPLKLSSEEVIDTAISSIDIQDPLQNQNDSKELNIWVARGILLFVAAIWGTNFASVKYLENLCFHPPCNHPPSEAAFARFAVAALVSFPLLWKQQKEVILAGLECGFWITLGYVSQALALSTISSGKCAFICSLTVVFVPLFGALVYGKQIKLSNLVAAAIALSGVGVLEGLIDFNELLGLKAAVAEDYLMMESTAITSSSVEAASAAASASGPLGALASAIGVSKGDILALGQPIGFGYTFLRIEHYQEKFKDVPNRVLTIAAAQCVAVGMLSLLWVLYDYHWTFPNFSYMIEPHRIATIAWTGIVTTVFAIFLEGIALQKATATDAAIAFSSEPVWASIFGFLLLHERLGTNAYIGGAIIMLACLVGVSSDLEPKKKEKEVEDNKA